MAEFIMKYLVAQSGRQNEFYVESAAVSTEEIGNDIYPHAKRMLQDKGIPFERRVARQMTRADYDYFDYIVCMDRSNLCLISYIITEDIDDKISLLLNWANINRDVADPWYTGDFLQTYNDIILGCQAMLKQL